MKRIFEDNDDNHNINTTNRKLKLQEWISLEKVNLSFEELYIVLNEIQEEITSRTTNIREMIPNDVWMSIFRSISYGNDLSFIVSLKSVCKSWEKVFLKCPLTVAVITKSTSMKWLPLFPRLQFLYIETNCQIPLDYFEKYLSNLVTFEFSYPDIEICYESALQSKEMSSSELLENILLKVDFIFGRMTKLKKLKLPESIFQQFELNTTKKTFPLLSVACLKSFKTIETLRLRDLPSKNYLQFFELFKSFINLKKLSIAWQWNLDDLNDDQIHQLQLILEDISRLEWVKFSRIDQINCYQIQKKNPKVRFQWYIDSLADEDIGKYEGSFNEKNNNREGRGVYLCAGTRYEGEWKNDVKEGKGIMRYYDGSRYEGEWKKNVKEGNGMIRYYDGSTYEGEWKNDNREGKGILIDGSEKYEGEWKNDRMEGKGTMIFSSGSKYEGEWKNDRMEGKGTIIFLRGGKYEGEWKNNRREGKGIFINNDTYEGDWKNDIGEGYGIMIYLNGDKYEGEWVTGKKEGRGTMFYSDGSKYEGEWKTNNREGKGVMNYSNGDKYEGEWVKGKKEGRGTMFYSDGNKYEGEWKNDTKLED